MNYFTKDKPRLIWSIQTESYSSDLIKTKSYFVLILIIHPRSNISGLSPLFGRCLREQSALGVMATGGEGAQARAMGQDKASTYVI
jgi:hypothetical protein